MNIIQKLLTAIRGNAREMGEAVVDSQSLRIFEQEIHDSQQHLVQAKAGLTEIVAKKMSSERKLADIQSEIMENEEYVRKALDKSDDSLAMQVAQKIAKLEVKASEIDTDLFSYKRNIEILKEQIVEAEKIISEHQRELAMVKTRESVQQATRSVTQTVSANQSSIGSARESLERIKQKQQNEQDKLEAGIQLRKEFEGDDLDKKLTAAGIKQDAHSAEAVLARLRAKK